MRPPPWLPPAWGRGVKNVRKVFARGKGGVINFYLGDGEGILFEGGVLLRGRGGWGGVTQS